MKYRILSLLIMVILTISFASLVSAKVEFVGKDTQTKGDWPNKYGNNGAILYAPKDRVDLKDITKYDVGNGLKWDWANPTQDKRGLVYPDDPKQRAGSCVYNNPVGTLTIETKVRDYQVAVYCVDWDSSVRSEDLVGYNANDKAPAKADATVTNPEFNAGIWYIWKVSGGDPFALQITFKGGANWVVSGMFIDVIKAPVDPNDKLATTWGSIRKY